VKIMIAYPALSGKGSPMLTQNRQFQWYHEPSYIYPVVSASAATILQARGYRVIWYDGIARKKSPDDFFRIVGEERPDLIVMESKTPVIRQHWDIVGKIKNIDEDIKTALMGDHVTALPEETMRSSPVDYAVTGGSYDFTLEKLAAHIDAEAAIPPGVWYREAGEIRQSGEFCLEDDLTGAPFIDRVLTQAWLYGEKWRRRTPFFYIMSGRDCPWHRCTFCAWTTLYPKFTVRPVEHVLDEIGFLISEHGAREIFDDTGTFPGGAWLERFCHGMIERGYHKKILFSCNMRFDYLQNPDIPRLMKRAGFRKVKAGLESANQKTLDRIDKGIAVEQIVSGCRNAAAAGLDVHLTVIVGYPWETRADAMNTLNLAKRLMEDGSAEMLQATVLVPYPGTPLFELGVRENLFRIRPDEYERFDMSEPVFTTLDMEPEEVMTIAGGIYKSFLSPRVILRNLFKIRSLRDISYIFRGARAVIGHLRDFLTRKPEKTKGERHG